MFSGRLGTWRLALGGSKVARVRLKRGPEGAEVAIFATGHASW